MGSENLKIFYKHQILRKMHQNGAMNQNDIDYVLLEKPRKISILEQIRISKKSESMNMLKGDKKHSYLRDITGSLPAKWVKTRNYKEYLLKMSY